MIQLAAPLGRIRLGRGVGRVAAERKKATSGCQATYPPPYIYIYMYI